MLMMLMMMLSPKAGTEHARKSGRREAREAMGDRVDVDRIAETHQRVEKRTLRTSLQESYKISISFIVVLNLYSTITCINAHSNSYLPYIQSNILYQSIVLTLYIRY